MNDENIPDLENDVHEEIMDPSEASIVFTKTRMSDSGTESSDQFCKVSTRETSNSKHLTIELTMEQAQMWADTLAAQLHEFRKQSADMTANIDMVYIVRGPDSLGNQPETVAFTRRAAVKEKQEMTEDIPWGEEAKIEQIDYRVE